MSSKFPRKIQSQTKGGQTFFIQVDDDDAEAAAASGPAGDSSGQITRGGDNDSGLRPKGVAQGEGVLRTDLFAKAVTVIQDLSQDVSNSLLEINPKPSEVQLSLALGFDAGGSVWILKGSAKATMTLALKWKLPDQGE